MLAPQPSRAQIAEVATPVRKLFDGSWSSVHPQSLAGLSAWAGLHGVPGSYGWDEEAPEAFAQAVLDLAHPGPARPRPPAPPPARPGPPPPPPWPWPWPWPESCDEVRVIRGLRHTMISASWRPSPWYSAPPALSCPVLSLRTLNRRIAGRHRHARGLPGDPPLGEGRPRTGPLSARVTSATCGSGREGPRDHRVTQYARTGDAHWTIVAGLPPKAGKVRTIVGKRPGGQHRPSHRPHRPHGSASRMPCGGTLGHRLW